VPIQPENFEEALLPHLNAAYNLARWLLRNDYDAEDVVQEAYLRAFRFFGDFRDGDARAWLLTIVGTNSDYRGNHRRDYRSLRRSGSRCKGDD
jgi:DNA-directed RNA polymerase specialized sigma24 family protein